MQFLGRWLSDAIHFGFAIVMGVLVMQVPALTRDYANGLLQVTSEGRRDIDQREATARQLYQLPAGSDDDLITALKAKEPANAQSLGVSLARNLTLREAHDRIAAAPSLLRPMVAFWDTTSHPEAAKSSILATTFATFTPQLLLNLDAVIYGLAGIVIGSFLAHAFLHGSGKVVSLARRRRFRHRAVLAGPEEPFPMRSDLRPPARQRIHPGPVSPTSTLAEKPEPRFDAGGREPRL